MTMLLRTAFAIVIVLASIGRSPGQTGAAKIDFAHDVVPVLKSRCAKCHTNGTYKGGMSLDTREALLKSKAVVPGKPGESELVKRVISKDKDMRMPPQGPGLTEKEIATLTSWVEEGATWEPGFSFKPATYVAPLKLRQIALPPAQAGRDHPIDRIVDAYFGTNKIEPPPLLDDAAFARRVYFDLIGLPPAASELQAFLVDNDPAKRTKLIGSLLGEKRSYADHWMAFWNDLLRNEYRGTGYIDGGRKQITGWLYQSLLDDKPYNVFVRELINPKPESEGFAKGIRWRGQVNASQIVELQFAQNVGQVFFGANLKCASCHDSFIDNWKLTDAYGLAAVVADKPLAIHRCDKPTGQTAGPRFLFSELGAIDAKLPKGGRLEQLAELVTRPDNGRFSRTIVNRLWRRLMGHGLVHPVDVMGNQPWSEDLLDYLAGYLIENKYDLKKLLAHIASSRAYQSRAAARSEDVPGDAYRFRGPELKRLTAEQFTDAVWMLTHTAPAKPVAPAPIPPFAASIPPERQFVRATLVDADDLMRSLGRPNREQVVTVRPEHLTTLQALDLSNGKTMTETLARGAANILKANPGLSADELVNWVFLRALCRPPAEAERVAGRELLGPKPTVDGLADFLWAVVMLPEFQLVR